MSTASWEIRIFSLFYSGLLFHFAARSTVPTDDGIADNGQAAHALGKIDDYRRRCDYPLFVYPVLSPQSKRSSHLALPLSSIVKQQSLLDFGSFRFVNSNSLPLNYRHTSTGSSTQSGRLQTHSPLLHAAPRAIVRRSWHCSCVRY